MTSKPDPQAPAFNFRNTPTAWRAVDLPTTKNIADKCTSGMNFTGCSKSLIYESVAKPYNSCKANGRKFVHLMDAAARIAPKLQREMTRQLSEKLNELASQFDADSK